MSLRTDTRPWKYTDACETVDTRDIDRSALSGVPKQSGPMGLFSHHHRQFRSRGGNHSPANLVLLTGSGTTGEHAWVHTHNQVATILGYNVPTDHDPAMVPIYRLDMFGIQYDWFLQTDHGELEHTPPPTIDATALAAALREFELLRLDSRLAAVKHL